VASHSAGALHHEGWSLLLLLLLPLQRLTIPVCCLLLCADAAT
jgi:hypothetical protein